MGKKQYLVLPIIMIMLLSGCRINTIPNNNISSKQANNGPADQMDASKEEYLKQLEKYYGDWYVYKMVCASRNFNEEYVSKVNINTKLTISENSIVFNDFAFTIKDVGEYSCTDLMDIFTVPLGGALEICDGKITDDGTILSKGNKVEYFHVAGNSTKVGFYLVIKGNETLLIHLGETYDTNAFYELKRVEPTGK